MNFILKGMRYLFDKDNIMKIEFEDDIGGYSMDKVALYNKNKITEQQAKEIIVNGVWSDQLIILDKVQFENIFKQ